MPKNKAHRKDDLKKRAQEDFYCDNIFRTPSSIPYLDSTQGGKWGRGKDDFRVSDEEIPSDNNPLPY